MIRIALPAASLLALAACVPTAETPQTPGDTPAAAYMALGTEPGWTLEITPSRLNYDGDYGETKIMVPNPGAKPSANGRTYTTDRLSVVIKPAPCSDGMSDRRYSDTVRVVADGKSLQGCGGKILPPDTLAGSNWSFVSIGGVPVAADRPTSLQFDGNRMSGSAGCNRFSGTYSVDGGTLKAGPLMATEMACPGAGMTQEAAFFKLMASPVSLTFADDGTLILTGIEGRTAVLRRVI
ncbi:TetR family transcriptional regulator [Sphingopyxis sp. H038]|uniref:META domain-containing protein n=1 Tax=unclassified Sphingopyxis TaxID=2614943 RepID=UPI0007313003|nr:MULTISPECIES: META domain-containing protein [unclassified Sphingopyxis]KTE02651.1 TetR family transcriptional regulator [Sphingopyxis sp. H012]KTE11212.1 TetR family transcriptional regulator [Sphingopyxis sp. H053]KTE12190.1 TetR family transcriptional regulator [Sphingopyxis sp. H093]KTE30693.1 TetR family transcriptional regulator [Sphingopyxis sp. H080]KTE35700.1 TetR family transcriptional regulator [Sphingopyxis sp. H038]